MFRLRALVVACFVALAVAQPARAQTKATEQNAFAWEVGPDLANVPNLTSAQALIVRAYLDASPTPIVLQNVTCQMTTMPNVYTCMAPVFAMVPGDHTIAITLGNEAGESKAVPVPPLPFRFVIVPKEASNLRFASSK